MPIIMIRKREDRAGMIVPVHCGAHGTEEHIEIKRGEKVEVSDGVYHALMNSHEADYVSVMSAPPEITTSEQRRKPGRPTIEEQERMRIGSAS